MVATVPRPQGRQRYADARTHPSLYVPVVIDDMTALDAAIVAYVRTQGRAGSTQLSDVRNWRIWEQHCDDLKVDPLDAPYGAYRELFLRRRSDGRLVAPGTIQRSFRPCCSGTHRTV